MLTRLGGVGSGLVMLLLVTHLLLMTTERHAAVMGPLMGVGSVPVVLAASVQDTALHEADGVGSDRPEEPHRSVLGDCPAQQAILPLLLVLLAWGVLAALDTTSLQATASPPSWFSRLPLLPPVAPARRRALLQIFQN